MLKVLNEVIKNIKQSEKSALIVLKGFNEEIFKEISKDIEPCLFLWIFWGQRADKILEDFFTTTMTDTERWDYIENYFLGKI